MRFSKQQLKDLLRQADHRRKDSAEFSGWVAGLRTMAKMLSPNAETAIKVGEDLADLLTQYDNGRYENAGSGILGLEMIANQVIEASDLWNKR